MCTFVKISFAVAHNQKRKLAAGEMSVRCLMFVCVCVYRWVGGCLCFIEECVCLELSLTFLP